MDPTKLAQLAMLTFQLMMKRIGILEYITAVAHLFAVAPASFSMHKTHSKRMGAVLKAVGSAIPDALQADLQILVDCHLTMVQDQGDQVQAQAALDAINTKLTSDQSALSQAQQKLVADLSDYLASSPAPAGS